MLQQALKNVNICFNTSIYSCLETSGGQSSNLYLNVVHFLSPVLIRHLWELKIFVFLHWFLICDVLLDQPKKLYDNEITSLIDIYFLRLSFIHQTFLDTLSDILESARAYL
jgi:hypothetical protein